MTATQRVWISKQAYKRLQEELADLKELFASEPDDADDPNTQAVQRARLARMQQIHELLVNATVGEDPPDDGVAEPGMVCTIRYDDSGEEETFLLGMRGAEYSDMEVYSVTSPLGAAILGARVGEQRTYTTPRGSELTVTLLKAVPYGMHTAAAAKSA